MRTTADPEKAKRIREAREAVIAAAKAWYSGAEGAGHLTIAIGSLLELERGN
jgi:hypothetical protein